MAKWLVERRLGGVSTRLRSLREELRIIDEQLVHLADDADDQRIRSLVSETPLAAHEFSESHRHVTAMAGRRDEIRVKIAELERRQDELLDRFTA